MKKILLTGAVGFIGFHLARRLKKDGHFVIGVDNFTPYYDVQLKKQRHQILKEEGIQVFVLDVCDQEKIEELIAFHQVSHVTHLAAQAGVRHSFHCPNDYISSNLNGFAYLLEALRKTPDVYLTFASSSSVYGNNQKIPFAEQDRTDDPSNLYAATKKSNETMAAAYFHLYNIRSSALRYFTVYGPWGRPDMAYFSFAKSILNNEPISVFNHGNMQRDFTYIDDIIDGTVAAIEKEADLEIFNLGNNHPIGILTLIESLEKALKRPAHKKMLPMQPGELITTYADITKSQKLLNYQPKVSFEEGIFRFVDWFMSYAITEKPLVKRQ